MPKLPVVSGKRVVRALERGGFVFDRQRGSHVILRHHERRLSCSVPVHGSQPVRRGTLDKILEDAGLAVEEFRRVLK